MGKPFSAQPVRRATGPREAAVVGATVGAWIALSALVSVAMSAITVTAATSGLYELESYGPMLAQQLGTTVVTRALPMGVGVLLSLWFIAPIWEGLMIRQVIARSIVAAAVSAGVAAVTNLLIDIVGALAMDRPLLSNSFPEVAYDGPGVVFVLMQALQGAVVGFFSLVPVLLAACLLLWQWCKAHAFAPEVAGVLED